MKCALFKFQWTQESLPTVSGLIVESRSQFDEKKIFTWVELRPSVSAITSLSDGVRYFWKANLFSSSFNWCAVKAVRDFRFFFVATFWPSKAENSDPDFPKASEHVSSSKALSGVSGVSSRISSIRKDRNFALKYL